MFWHFVLKDSPTRHMNPSQGSCPGPMSCGIADSVEYDDKEWDKGLFSSLVGGQQNPIYSKYHLGNLKGSMHLLKGLKLSKAFITFPHLLWWL